MLSGSVEIYSGTALLETHPFRTDASAVYTVVLGRLIDRDVRIGYAANGYPRQFYDRAAVLADATPLRLTVGQTALTSRLLPPTVLNITLLDDLTGDPVRNAYGEVNVYANTAQIQTAGHWIDLSTEIDRAANLLTVTSDRAGQFAVFGVPKGRVFLPMVAK